MTGELEEHGEGLHHLCFGVDDVATAVARTQRPGLARRARNGRGRVSSFVTAAGSHGVRIECTEFDRAIDVDALPGFLLGETGEQPTANRTARSDGKDE